MAIQRAFERPPTAEQVDKRLPGSRDGAGVHGLSRRGFLKRMAALTSGLALGGAASATAGERRVSLFLSGDVMLGRGIDQIMPQSTDSRLFEPFLRDARQYIQLAEAVNGPIPREVDPTYVWGDALQELGALSPEVRIVNLENAVTLRGSPWPGKGIHYRMHPANTGILRAAEIDCCVLANNHVLDWGETGLEDTLKALHAEGITTAGAGIDHASASAPAVVPVTGDVRVRVIGLASESSGVPPDWQAGSRRPGVNLLAGDLDEAVDVVRRAVVRKSAGDIVVVSVHWGGNWGYRISPWQRQLAHALIDSGMVDIVHGHSSHHPKGIEIHRGRLVIYGCGDLINDYEGIRGHEAFRSDLRLMYFPVLDAGSGRLMQLRATPMRMAGFRLQRASSEEAGWLRELLNREGGPLGTRFLSDTDGRLVLLPADRRQE